MAEARGARAGERYAEKDRAATCAFADAVAEAARAACEARCPTFLETTLQNAEQTVLAAVLITRAAEEKGSGEIPPPEVLAFGIGTKFVRQAVKDADKAEGRLVHDAHAEILARRAFLQVVIRELAKLKVGAASDLLEPSPETGRARLAAGAHLHLYTSSTPCGNSSVRRWASAKPEPKAPTELAAHIWPALSHDPISLANRGEGQIAASVKRDAAPSEADGAEQVDEAATDKGKPVFAQGTAEPGTGQGNILSCSDKIALWNMVGLQGKWLSALVEPMYLSTLTVGRKFSRRHLQRAVCCRLQEVPAQDMFRLHHPVLLRTSVKLNRGNVAQDAQAAFSNTLAVHWARGDLFGASFLHGDEGTRAMSSKEAENAGPPSTSSMSSKEADNGSSPGLPTSSESAICRRALRRLAQEAGVGRSQQRNDGVLSSTESLDEAETPPTPRPADVYKRVKSQALEVMMRREPPPFVPRKRRRQRSKARASNKAGSQAESEC